MTGVYYIHRNMPLISDWHPNPGWRVVWGGQKDPGNTIRNLGVDSEGKEVGHWPPCVLQLPDPWAVDAVACPASSLTIHL